jgi:hypothetical protein
MQQLLRYFLSCFFFLSIHITFAQKIAVADSVAQIKFYETTYDFGTTKESEKLEHTFLFENKGKLPLILANVMTTCGCTVTKWTKKPLLPGEIGEIMVRFDTKGKIGQQTKIITVISNAYNARERLFIRTVVVKKDEN